jgi:hypothetical protein
VEEAAQAGLGGFAVIDAGESGWGSVTGWVGKGEEEGAHRVVLMLSVGVTARRDSVTPAPKPARTVLGPVILPSASARSLLYWSKATNPNPAVNPDCLHN